MNLFGDFLTLFYPAFCYGCGNGLAQGEELVCTECRVKLPYTNYHLLPEEDNPLAKRFFGRLPIANTLAYLTFVRAGRVQQLLFNLKYRNVPEIGDALGKWYGFELKKSGKAANFDLILPVPLHPAKFRKRGYNQSDGFARGLSEALGIPWSSQVLARRADSSTQTRKSRYARWENVETIFTVEQPEMVKEKHVLLVDDVMTTGATLEACGQELLKCGCSSLSLATIAAA